MLLGATLYGLFVASLSSLMNSMDSGGSLYNSKLDMVNEYMHQLRLYAVGGPGYQAAAASFTEAAASEAAPRATRKRRSRE